MDVSSQTLSIAEHLASTVWLLVGVFGYIVILVIIGLVVTNKALKKTEDEIADEWEKKRKEISGDDL